MKLSLVERSNFNTRFRVELSDGAAVEAVHYRGDTLCVSSQVGCAVRCPFCASGAQGLSRPLSLAELCGQVEAVRAHGLSVDKVTVSGVGEPLHNARNVLAFIEACRAQNIAPSLTTSGGPIAQLSAFLHAPHNGLTLSIHAGSEPMRARMVPAAPSLADIFACLARELPTLSRSRRKKVALAYLLLAAQNDSDPELDAFAERAVPLGLAVHLYAYNPVPTSCERPVTRERYEAVYGRLRGYGLVVRMSSQARLEANGGCGTLLAIKHTSHERGPLRS
jgi:23S rRNA (adenine2503-C2)-methyltransferase